MAFFMSNIKILAEYKAAYVCHLRHKFSIFVTLKVHTSDFSGQGQGEHHWKLGVWMVTSLYMSFGQGQAEQQVTHSNCLSSFHVCLFSVVFALCACFTDSSPCGF